MLAGFYHEEDWYQILQLWLGHSKVGLALERDGAERGGVLVDQDGKDGGGEMSSLDFSDALLEM